MQLTVVSSENLQLFHPTLASGGCKLGGHGPGDNAVKHQRFVCFQCDGKGYAVCLCPLAEDCEEVDDGSRDLTSQIWNGRRVIAIKQCDTKRTCTEPPLKKTATLRGELCCEHSVCDQCKHHTSGIEIVSTPMQVTSWPERGKVQAHAHTSSELVAHWLFFMYTRTQRSDARSHLMR